MKFDRFEDILVWQKSIDLCVSIYQQMESSNDFGFKNQIQRAAVSISNNIAEGYERKTNNEFKYFLYISKGSCGEVRSMLVLAYELHKISQTDLEDMSSLSEEISKMLSGFIKTL
jgi:four helix bundle protein